MIEILAGKLHWLEGSDAQKDLCAHGTVSISVNEQQFVPDEIYCVSAAAVFLLRTLDENFIKDPEDQLIPHCGHSMIAREDSSDVLLLGCPHGYDFDAKLDGDTIHLKFDGESEVSLRIEDWKRAVFAFSDQIRDFYDSARDKLIVDEFVAAGYRAFRNEWDRRRGSA